MIASTIADALARRFNLTPTVAYEPEEMFNGQIRFKGLPRTYILINPEYAAVMRELPDGSLVASQKILGEADFLLALGAALLRAGHETEKILH